MALQEVKLDWSDFEQKLARRIATGARAAYEVAAEQARGVIREVLNITPPGHEGSPGPTREGQTAGRAAVARDIAKLYGTPNDGYDLIAQKSQAAASAFWFTKTHNPEAAASIVREKLGISYSPFDGGALHQRFLNKRGRVARGRGIRKPIIIVRDPPALEHYVEKKQGHVFWLMSGWKGICEKLGIALPAMVSQHSGPGLGTVEVTESHIRIFAANDVSFAAATDLQRRIQWAIDAQIGKMNRQWEDYVAKRFWLQSGFRVTA